MVAGKRMVGKEPEIRKPVGHRWKKIILWDTGEERNTFGTHVVGKCPEKSENV
jgi:hypothetical protein